MTTAIDLLHRLCARHDGATAVEYGLIAGGIAATILVAVFGVGTDLTQLWQALSAKFQAVFQ